MRHLFLTGAAAAALLPMCASAQTTSTATSDRQPVAETSASQSIIPGFDPHEIVVTASPFLTEANETPSIVEKVDRDTILQKGGANIADALKDVPGIAATGFAAGASRPIIRGMSGSRVRILEDGTSSSDVSDIGPDHGVPIDPLAAQSIEVVRGAATLRYGSQAIGGVVNVLNNRVPTALPVEKTGGEANGSFDTVNNAKQFAVMTDDRFGKFALHVDGFDRLTDNYDTPLGVQRNSYDRSHGGSIGGSYFFGGDDASHVGVAVTQFNSIYGIPSDTTHINLRQTKVLTRDSVALGSGLFKTFNVDASYADYSHDEVEPTGELDTTFANKEFDGRGELLLAPIGPLANTAIGTEIQHRDFSAVGEDSSYLFPSTDDSQAGYLFTEAPIGNALKLQASGRVEHVHINGTPKSNVPTTLDFTPLSGAVGALLTASHAIRVGLTFSSTGRAPALPELFARGGHDGPDTYETGDPGLGIERANSLEASLRVNTAGFHLEGSLYATWFHNYIYGDLTGRSCDDDGDCMPGFDGDLKELNYRQQGAYFRGAEAEVTYKLIRSERGTLELRALADYTRATLDDGSNVPRIPPYRAGGGATWKSDRIEAGVLYLRNGRQNEAGAFDDETPAYNDLGAHIAWHPIRDNPNIELEIVGQNLTDDVQRDAAALNRDEVVLPGRNVRFVVRLATF